MYTPLRATVSSSGALYRSQTPGFFSRVCPLQSLSTTLAPPVSICSKIPWHWLLKACADGHWLFLGPVELIPSTWTRWLRWTCESIDHSHGSRHEASDMY